MARNRKNESAAARLAPALKVLLFCALLVSSGIGYVWYKNQVQILGRDIVRLERDWADLKLKNKLLREKWASLSSPPELEARIKKLNMGMGPPDPSKVFRLNEPVPGSQAPISATPATAASGDAGK